jgi:hypothetical protein
MIMKASSLSAIHFLYVISKSPLCLVITICTIINSRGREGGKEAVLFD